MTKSYKCKNCDKEFSSNQSTKTRIIKFCSKKCSGLFRKGKFIPWLNTPDILKKIAKDKLSRRDEGNYKWKGDQASHQAIHTWLRTRYGNANRCDNPKCVYPRLSTKGKLMLKPKAYNYALIHGKKHGHNVKRYFQLCNSCHSKYDRFLIKIPQ